MSDTITVTSQSIKKRIMLKILANLEPLKVKYGIRSIRREQNPALVADKCPCMTISDSEEVETAKDFRGRTFQFDVGLMLNLEAPKDIGAAKDEIVPCVQKIMEDPANLQLGGLAVLVDGGREIPFIEEALTPRGGAMLIYTVTYRRVRGNPYQTY